MSLSIIRSAVALSRSHVLRWGAVRSACFQTVTLDKSVTFIGRNRACFLMASSWAGEWPFG